MDKNMIMISKYSSRVSTEVPYFETEERQKTEVKSLVQSNEDLMRRYLELKKNLEHTNLHTAVEMKGTEYSISELLVLKRKMAKTMIETFDSLTARSASMRLSSIRRADGEAQPKVLRLYKEEDKNAGLDKWQDMYNNIDARLEVINATCDLLELT